MTPGVHYLLNLQRLLRLRKSYGDDINDWGVLLFEAAIKATVLECGDFGLATEAERLVKREGRVR